MNRFPTGRACRRWLTAALLALAGAATAPALAQGTSAKADARTPAATTPSARPTAPTTAPRQRIELPAAERQALDAGQTRSAPSVPTQAELVPSAADARAPVLEEPQTRIEQVRTGNRISEVRVTPALTGRTYTITNREGRQPTSAFETSPGLSVPKFFTFEWGRPEERAAPSLPPPPSSSTPR
jgi:hypothetical protein